MSAYNPNWNLTKQNGQFMRGVATARGETVESIAQKSGLDKFTVERVFNNANVNFGNISDVGNAIGLKPEDMPK